MNNESTQHSAPGLDLAQFEGHTPGPWFFHLGRGAEPRYHVHTDGGYQIASSTRIVDHPVAAEENAMRFANTTLIAAAPAMLAELQQLRAQRDRLAGALAETSNQLTELLCSRQLDSTLPPFYAVKKARNVAGDALASLEGGAK